MNNTRFQPFCGCRNTALSKVAAFILTLLFTSLSIASSDELVFLTWADYIDPEIVAEFENETGIKIKFSYYESDDARDEILSTTDGQGYDLAIVNGLMLESYANRNWLTPIHYESAHNIHHIGDRWRDAFPASKHYAVPYFWGTLGIAYRKDLIPEGFTSWKHFFEPAERLRGKITMLKSSRDILGMALKSIGHSANTDDRQAIKEAGRLLQAQKPFVRSYEYISLNEESALVSGDVWASLAYSGDALMLQEHHDDIVYVVPKEGGNLWVDYLTVFQASPRKELANRFIDFLNKPGIAARNAEYVYYATPNLAAMQHVSDDYTEDTAIFPTPSVIERSEVYSVLSPRAQKTVNSVFASLVN